MYAIEFTDPILEEYRREKAYLKGMIKQKRSSIVETRKGTIEVDTLDGKLNFPAISQQIKAHRDSIKVLEGLIEKRKEELQELQKQD